MSSQLRVAVVGLGIGRSHIQAYRNIPDKFEVLATCDLDEAKAREIADTLRVPRFTRHFSEICRMKDVDVIDVCTPSFLHFEQTLEAIMQGKNVICEKPLSGSLKDIDRLAVAEKESAKRVMPIFQYRFGNGLQKLRMLVAHGVTGRPHLATVETAWRRREDYYAVAWRGKWKTELGGTLVTHAIHALDMLIYILGPAKRIFARTATRVHRIEVEDCLSASLEMADGSLASISATVGSSVEISRHRFCFSNLSAESNIQPYANSRDPWAFTGDTEFATKQIERILGRYIPQPEGYEGQFIRYYESIRKGEAPPVTLEDARTVIETITAIYGSSRSGKEVELPIYPDHPLYASWAPSS